MKESEIRNSISSYETNKHEKETKDESRDERSQACLLFRVNASRPRY